MTAQGKVNASKVQAGDRILVRPLETNLEGRPTITPSGTKTGADVTTATVLDKTFRAASGPYERMGKYVITTTAGTIEAAAIQTMWLAPEDAAGIKRAYAEALAEDADRTAAAERAAQAQAEMDEATANQATPQWRYFAEATRKAGGYAGGMRALEIEAHAELADRNWAARVETAARLFDVLVEVVAQPEKRADTPEIIRLREEYKTAGPFKRVRIEDRLAYLGAVLYPEGTPEYAAYRQALTEALAAPGAWDFLDK